MEEAILKMKKRNDELVKENRDAVDSPGSPKFIPPNEQIIQLRDELSKQEIEHSERIVEMVSVNLTVVWSDMKDEQKKIQNFYSSKNLADLFMQLTLCTQKICNGPSEFRQVRLKTLL